MSWGIIVVGGGWRVVVIGGKEGREKAIGTQGGVNKSTFPPHNQWRSVFFRKPEHVVLCFSLSVFV